MSLPSQEYPRLSLFITILSIQQSPAAAEDSNNKSQYSMSAKHVPGTT